MILAQVTLAVLGIYLLIGALFAFAFVLKGANRIDPDAVEGSWGFRILIFPASAMLWPLLLRRWMKVKKS